MKWREDEAEEDLPAEIGENIMTRSSYDAPAMRNFPPVKQGLENNVPGRAETERRQ